MSDVNLERAKASPTVNTRVNDIAGTTKKLFGYPLIILLLFSNGEIVVLHSFRGSRLGYGYFRNIKSNTVEYKIV